MSMNSLTTDAAEPVKPMAHMSTELLESYRQDIQEHMRTLELLHSPRLSSAQGEECEKALNTGRALLTEIETELTQRVIAELDHLAQSFALEVEQ